MTCGPFAGPDGVPPMIKVKRIDHVAIAVGYRDGTGQTPADLLGTVFGSVLGNVFGMCAGACEHVPDQKTDVVFWHARSAESESSTLSDPSASPSSAAMGTSHDTALEVIAPAGPDGNPGLVRFLEKRGPGLHHICFEVEDLPAALASLKAAGVRLIDETPRPGARGHLVAFLHPASTGGVLFELCATPQGAQA